MGIVDNNECIHGLGPVSACVICNGRERREAKQRALEAELVRGRYPRTLAARPEARWNQLALADDDDDLDDRLFDAA